MFTAANGFVLDLIDALSRAKGHWWYGITTGGYSIEWRDVWLDFKATRQARRDKDLRS